jgi:hypothetical protein
VQVARLCSCVGPDLHCADAPRHLALRADDVFDYPTTVSRGWEHTASSIRRMKLARRRSSVMNVRPIRPYPGLSSCSSLVSHETTKVRAFNRCGHGRERTSTRTLTSGGVFEGRCESAGTASGISFAVSPPICRKSMTSVVM